MQNKDVISIHLVFMRGQIMVNQLLNIMPFPPFVSLPRWELAWEIHWAFGKVLDILIRGFVGTSYKVYIQNQMHI